MKKSEATIYRAERTRKEEEIKLKEQLLNLLTTKGVLYDGSLSEEVIYKGIKTYFSPDLLAYFGITAYPATLEEFLNIFVTIITTDKELVENFRANFQTASNMYRDVFIKQKLPRKTVSGSFADILNKAVFKFQNKRQ